MEEAEKIYLKGLALTENEVLITEMIANLSMGYYDEKNKEKFDEWYTLAKKYLEEDSPIFRYYEYWEK